MHYRLLNSAVFNFENGANIDANIDRHVPLDRCAVSQVNYSETNIAFLVAYTFQ